MNLEDLGWGEPFASAFAASDVDGATPARVVAVHRGHLVVAGPQGEALAVVAGRARERATIGDWVVVDARGVVGARLPRRGVLARAGQDLAANVDVAFVVTSANRDLNARRLERFVAVAAAGGCEPVIVLNKADLVADLEPALAVLRAAAPGVPALVASAQRGDGVDALAAQLGRGRTGVLIGSSGVGKSTLVNALLGGGRQATAEIRARDDRGRHTTTNRALFALPHDGGLLVDTPGVRLPRMSADPAGVAAAFADVEALAMGCRFSDCRHDTEPGCAVRAAIATGELDPARLRHRSKLEGEQRWAARPPAVGQAPARANLVPVRRALFTCLLVALLGAASAQARVALLATGTNEVALLDVTTDQVVARPPLPGPSRAVAITRDGSRAFAAAGNAVAAFDLGMVPAAPLPGTAAPFAVITRDLGAPAVGIAVSPGGASVYAAAGQRLFVLDARTLAIRHRVRLHGTASALALSREGALAAVVLAKGRVAMVATGAPKLLRRVKVKGATGAAFDVGARAWISAPRRLYLVRQGARKPEKHPLSLGKGVGGAVAASPDGLTLAVGAAHGGADAALVDVAGHRVRRFRSGRGPGAPGWSPDGVRVYYADGGGASLSLVSPFAHRRLGSVALPGTTPLGVVVQPGLARVQGTDLPDAISGTRLRDLIAGLGGDDVLRGGRENDILEGGLGNDTLFGGSYDDHLFGGVGDDTLNGGSGNDHVSGDDGNDRADGGTGDDSIHGGPGNDYLDGGPGDDHVFGEAGDDEIVDSTFGNDRRLYGGPGNDLIKGGRGSDLIKGGDGNDQLFGESGTENITGGDGDDLIDGGAARDILAGNNGSDVIHGDSGDDTLEGGNGADQVDGGSGPDEIFGDDGADLLVGGPDADTIDGGDGDDTIRAADDSRDEIDCGAGNDTVYVEDDAPTRDVLLNCETVTPVPPEGANDSDAASVVSGTQARDVLHGTPGDDSLFGKGGPDVLFGAGGDDYVDGEYGNDELHGGPGNDTMAGRSGDDRIFGDAGDDHITGDRGFDHISGGSGDDEIFGNLDPDTISGGPGNDRINVVRGDIDSVKCGPGHDVVFADPGDKVAGDCEDVRR